MKNLLKPKSNRRHFSLLLKIPNSMRITLVLLFGVIFHLESSNIYSQSTYVTLDLKDTTIENVLNTIEKKTEFYFLYNSKLIDVDQRVSITTNNQSIESVLNTIFKKGNIDYDITGKQIVLSPKAINQQGKRNISGVIRDRHGDPVIGGTVTEKNTTNGTMTNLEGNFKIEVSENATLLVSFIGYETQEIKVKDKSNIEVVLEEDTRLLDEVVVVGYGTQKKVNVTGSISSIDVTKEAESRPLTNLSTVLSGMSAGVQTFQSSGRPNGDVAEITIRGLGTLNNSAPLVLVDGFEQSINDVNPNDVANISILKDAASSSIYGNRGANGVILITTKKGEEGKTTVNYSGLFSVNQPSNLLELVSNSADYFELINESAYNIGQGRVFSQNTLDLWRAAEKDPNGISEHGYPNYVAYPNTNWYKEIFQNKIQSEHTVSVTGASKKANYNFSGTFLNNPGLIEGTGLQKYFVRSNIAININDWLKVGNYTYGFYTDQERNDISAFTGGIHGQKLPPDIYPYYDGKYGMPEAPEEDPTSSNPFHMLNSSGGSFAHNKINTAFFAEATILNDFQLRTEFDYSHYLQEAKWLSKRVGRNSFRDPNILELPVTTENMSSAFYLMSIRDWRFLTTLNWNKTIGKHEIGALMGYESSRNWGYDADMAKKNATNENISDLSTYTEMTNITGNSWETTSQSYFGRITYAFDSRYLLETNMRYDGSSLFAPKYRWGFFPSVSAGWRISEESFMENLPFDNLKLRASWGQLGNNSISAYEWQHKYNKSNYIFGDKLTSGLAQLELANERIQWESTTLTNVGLEFAFLNARLSGEIDFYNKLTNDILYRPSIYATIGNKLPPRQNLADITNRGVEFALNWNSKVGDLSYKVSGNFSFNKNWTSKYKGKLERGWILDDNGNQIYYSNQSDVSEEGQGRPLLRITEGRTTQEYLLHEPYKGDGSYYLSNGLPNPVGGPKDGMIRTEQDMNWLRAMQAEGYSFYPNQVIGTANLWYGDYIYADNNGDGIYGNENDRMYQDVSMYPKYHYGLQASASWKGIDFSMNWGGAAGFSIYWNSVGQNSTSTIIGYGISQRLQKDHYFYDPSNPDDPRTNLNSKNSRLTLNQTNQSTVASTLFLEKGDYLKLRNLTIGYTLPHAWTRSFYASKVRVFASGENLWTITGFSGMDPEMRTGMGYVTMRQFAFGVNINF